MKFKLAIGMALVFALSINAAFANYVNPTDSVAPKNWFNLDESADGVRGVSTEVAYNSVLKGKTSRTVVVAVIDSGIDIEHEDLKDIIWVNADEIPGNGKDDDGNGYVDISFSRQMEPYICMIEGNYTTQVLLSSARLRDTNASNLYQLIRQKISEKKERYFDIGVDELKDELALFTTHYKEKIYSYPLFKEFNRSVIKLSIETITDTTEIKDLKVEIIERKQRKASKLRFTYRVDEQMKFDGF